ncbi:MAG: NAD(P)/FAD-dependent oxidoreductase, partial [Dokdonella sp.]
MTESCDIAVIGGGAAGLMCALTAGQRGRRVRVIEHANRVGKKILMSGGGRCNFTHLGTTPANFISANPHFCKSALARYTPADFVEMVERHGIAYHEKDRGQLFCDVSSKLIVQMLLDECAAAAVRIETGCRISGVTPGSRGFLLDTSSGTLQATSLVVASGGLSIPSMGASGFGHDLARQFGIGVLPLRAGLVPLTLSGTHQQRLHDLSGVSLSIGAHCNGQRFDADMMITHRGVSGPAILQISSYWQPGDDLRLDLAPGKDLIGHLHAQRRDHASAELRTVLAECLPRRFAIRLCELWLGSKPMRQYTDHELRTIATSLHDFALVASGTEGYRTAEVTLGGVDTDALSSSTMQARGVPGLHFIGEVV